MGALKVRKGTRVWQGHIVDTDGMPSGRTTLQDSALPAPTLLEWPFQEQRGFGLTASAPVTDVSVLHKWGLASVVYECDAEVSNFTQNLKFFNGPNVLKAVGIYTPFAIACHD